MIDLGQDRYINAADVAEITADYSSSTVIVRLRNGVGYSVWDGPDGRFYRRSCGAIVRQLRAEVEAEQRAGQAPDGQTADDLTGQLATLYRRVDVLETRMRELESDLAGLKADLARARDDGR